METALETDELILIEPEDCDAYAISQGILMVGRSDKFSTNGFIEINPLTTLPKEARPVPAMFRQVEGSSLFKGFIEGTVKEKTLKSGEVVKLQPDTPYEIHNQTRGKSLLFWKFDGDLLEAFDKLRKDLPGIPFQPRKKSGRKDLFNEHMKRLQKQ